MHLPHYLESIFVGQYRWLLQATPGFQGGVPLHELLEDATRAEEAGYVAINPVWRLTSSPFCNTTLMCHHLVHTLASLIKYRNGHIWSRILV